MRSACCNAEPQDYINNRWYDSLVRCDHPPFLCPESLVLVDAKDARWWLIRFGILTYRRSCSPPIPLEITVNLLYLYYPVYCSTIAF